jgi:hypothetical protein
VVLCFVKPEDAGAFAERFGGGDGQPAAARKTSGRPERDVQVECKVQNISSCRRTGPMDGQDAAPDLVVAVAAKSSTKFYVADGDHTRIACLGMHVARFRAVLNPGKLAACFNGPRFSLLHKAEARPLRIRPSGATLRPANFELRTSSFNEAAAMKPRRGNVAGLGEAPAYTTEHAVDATG